MPLLNSFLSILFKRRLQKIDYFKKHPVEVQKDTLQKLLYKAKNTEWGKRYDFATIKTEEEFKAAIPLQDYESLKKDIYRLRAGEKNILWPSQIQWFAKSSGTSNNRSKYIPVSREALEDCHFRGGKDIIQIYVMQNPDNQIFKGKGLTMGGSHKIDSERIHYTGDLSAILIENLPFWITFIRTPNPKIALIDEWEEKVDKIVKTTVKENVVCLLGVPSWNLSLIKYLLSETKKDNLLEVWPNLEIFVHGGINFEPYRKQYEMLIPSPTMKYMNIYNASEGFFAIQDDLNSSSMLLMLDYGVYYEFIPLKELKKKNPKTLSISEVETGKEYALVISTNGGLWRYSIGDTIMFTSVFPHKIKIIGRISSYINAFGEELSIDNAEQAITKTCQKTNVIIKEFTVAPIYITEKNRGSHEWIIEFEKPPSNLTDFLQILDSELQNINSDYAAKRYKDITMEHPKITIARQGLFYGWLKAKGKLGGQNKVPRLSNDRALAEELLAMN